MTDYEFTTISHSLSSYVIINSSKMYYNRPTLLRVTKNYSTCSGFAINGARYYFANATGGTGESITIDVTSIARNFLENNTSIPSLILTVYYTDNNGDEQTLQATFRLNITNGFALKQLPQFDILRAPAYSGTATNAIFKMPTPQDYTVGYIYLRDYATGGETFSTSFLSFNLKGFQGAHVYRKEDGVYNYGWNAEIAAVPTMRYFADIYFGASNVMASIGVDYATSYSEVERTHLAAMYTDMHDYRGRVTNEIKMTCKDLTRPAREYYNALLTAATRIVLYELAPTRMLSRDFSTIKAVECPLTDGYADIIITVSDM